MSEIEGVHFLALTLLITIVGWLLILVVPNQNKSKTQSFFIVLNSLLSSIPAIQVIQGGTFSHVITGLGFFGDIPLRIDLFSAWFMVLINVIFVLSSFYAIGYIDPTGSKKENLSIHWMGFVLFHLSLLWVSMVQNFLAFLMVWEIMSLSGWLLIIYNNQNTKVIKAGVNYLVHMHIGVAVVTIAFIWVMVSEHSMDFLAIKSFFSHHDNRWLFLLFFIGFGFKSAFMPFHTWSPYVQTHAPAHISAVMAVKVGLFMLFKIVFFVQHDYLLIGQWLLTVSLLTALFGIINASVHRNYMELLAYSSVENVGIIGSGIGLGFIGLGYQNHVLAILGFGSAILHLLNHSLFKPLLFFAAGAVYQKTNTRNMEKLGGLIKQMPKTALIFLAGALAIGGLPPFNGFVSEFVLYSGFVAGIKSVTLYDAVLLISGLAGISVVGGISIYAFTKSFGIVFLGTPRVISTRTIEEPNKYMRIPSYLIILLMLSIGLFPMLYFKEVVAMLTPLVPMAHIQEVLQGNLMDTVQSIGKFALLFIAFTTLIVALRYYFVKKHTLAKQQTWGCGYVAPSAKIQYTGKSFSKTFGKLLNKMVLEMKSYKELEQREYFPEARKHSAFYTDMFEYRIIDGSTNNLNYFMNRFQFIQNGSLQQYIVYGLAFIALLFLGTILNML
ncbi:MAG TPA: hypothetical protein DCQ26_09800 [Marinilabiliales bacterium]|jgi:formate hydrogenlyase subunit 3/multisubunit Na+/H+ antiporter MnhD subunit|nr:MAG: hypothetical protein A2W95_13525 [Bacteroidetes bacterium GWA2_40_14]OFX66213.1 MAG: hypothetical protein A2W84_08170 [Bacteroidetes bacterium GWC2_40_13]OFX74536.1 MAG: hypothetical protein A2W96_19730 [Bacteroidetes bacterium GWD2_40_43]OFX92049.1 MAG: hypothetical protein A2W97_08250 [Bacteroidetes bacterium GWE2_40_63]OFY16673.1 MAG: hypothetical protein A2W88_15925 [Bacteroidetes bacterium GWF2_40_13]OFZ27046.1 MAG: hypothetical protein A2437_16700 [Bacteroidetes bacterium RIFOXYC